MVRKSIHFDLPGPGLSGARRKQPTITSFRFALVLCLVLVPSLFLCMCVCLCVCALPGNVTPGISSKYIIIMCEKGMFFCFPRFLSFLRLSSTFSWFFFVPFSFVYISLHESAGGFF